MADTTYTRLAEYHAHPGRGIRPCWVHYTAALPLYQLRPGLYRLYSGRRPQDGISTKRGSRVWTEWLASDDLISMTEGKADSDRAPEVA